jgi:hypothetical protein
MAFDVETLLAYWQLIATIVVFLVLIMGVLRYREKKSEIARELVWAFVSFFFAALTQTLGSFFNLYGFMVGSIQIGTPYWPINLILHLIKVFVAAYSVLIIGFYFIYRFSQILIRKQGDKPRISNYIVPIWMIAIILYGIAKVYIIFPPMDEVASIFSGMDVWVVFYSWFVIFPILSESIKLRRKIEKQDPSYAKIGYLVAMALGMVILITCFVLETIYQIAFGINGPNLFSFIAWIFVIFSIIVAYLALYKK